MPEPKKGSGKGLTKKLGPLPVWGWAVAGGVGFLGYRFLRARSASNATVASLGTTGGGATGTIPIGGVGGASPSTGVAGTFASMGAWEQAMLGFLTGNGLSPGDAYSAMSSWLLGNCVSQQAYNAIAAALVSPSVGLPPGFTTNTPTLSVCPAVQQTPTQDNPHPTPPPSVPSLPAVIAADWPQIVKFGSYSPSEFTQIGTVENGQYSGKQVGGGVPVYANVFGGFAQGSQFGSFANLPNGTGVYVPSVLAGYVQ